MEATYVLDYDVYAVSREQRLFLLARIKGADAATGSRPPLNLGLVIDRSGSMAGDKLDRVKQAAAFLVKHLDPSDRLSLVTYDNVVTVEIASQKVVHKDLFTAILSRITSGGTTNLSGGWLQGCTEVAAHLDPAQVNRVLLLTDGLANQGVTDPDQLTAMAAQRRAEGITTTTIGVGMDFNEDLLTAMAAAGGGAFYFIDDPDQAPTIFGEEIQGLLNVVGQNLTISAAFLSGVRLARQLTLYRQQGGGERASFFLGDLFGGEEKVLVLELEVPAMDNPGEVQIAHLRFEYDELGDGSVTHRVINLPVRLYVVPEDRLGERAANTDVLETVLLLEAANARREAVRHADRGDFAQARDTLSRAADAIADSRVDSPELRAERDMLRESAIDMDLGARRYDAYYRKASTSRSFAMGQSSSTIHLTHEQHERLRRSRPAVERGGPTPRRIRWESENLPLDRDEIRIGRSKDNDIVLDDGQVSRHHCRIIRRGDDLYLEDLDSSGGTFANGGLLLPGEGFRLSVGDVLMVGSVLFSFYDAAPADAQEAPPAEAPTETEGNGEETS
ncbi:MAG: hypothetical protein Kow00124_21600 [Anaerolineae bacterium]